MSKPPKALLRQWDEKLKRAGFSDIEMRLNNGDTHLRQYHSSLQYRTSAAEYTERLEYYEIAANFLHEHKFTSAKAKKIWALFADGEGDHAIAAKLKVPRGQVNAILRRLRRLCYGLRYPTSKGLR